RHLTSHRLDEIVDIRIQTLTQVQAFANDVFAPLPQAAVRDWCAGILLRQPDLNGDDTLVMDPPSSARGLSQSLVLYTVSGLPKVILPAPGELLAYYVLIGKDGAAQSVVPLRANDPFSQDKIDTIFHSVRFQVENCAGKPVLYDRVVYPFTTITSPEVGSRADDLASATHHRRNHARDNPRLVRISAGARHAVPLPAPHICNS
ncbi:MAG: hypothetical protein ACRD4M_07885, partial [Candidatus Acidiferrales bacterium]